MEKNAKNVNIELIRIISMLMIVYHHYSVHTDWNFPKHFSNNTTLIQNVGSMGKIGVILFVLITGYFYSQSKVKIKKIIKLSNISRWNLILSLLITMFFINKPIELSKEDAFNILFPISFNAYWFVTTFAIILLLSPFLNSYLNNTERSKKLASTLVFILLLHIPVFIGIVSQTPHYFVINEILSFIYIIFLGDLIKEYKEELLTKYFKYTILTLLLSGALILSQGYLFQPYNSQKNLLIPWFFLKDINSINGLLFSVSIFIVILKIKIKNKKFILFISPAVFDIYLLHDNAYTRPIIWNTFFNNKNSINQSESLLFIKSIFEPLLVFVVCLLLAMIRCKLLPLIKNKILIKKTTQNLATPES
ncbi:MAG: acyltransferase [Streptococcaceae bacterium]|nr:acyltransferase [Streptococcaceae bacterium]MCH4178184.1 acyltransferase [Streptococcaceae bacterium]